MLDYLWTPHPLEALAYLVLAFAWLIEGELKLPKVDRR